MNQEEFISAIKIAVVDSTVKSIKSVLIKPPGRQPGLKLLETSKWFNNLNEIDKNMVLDIVQETAETSLFSFLCVLDGVSAIEGRGEKGKLNLYFEKNGVKTFLNNPDDDLLHELL